MSVGVVYGFARPVDVLRGAVDVLVELDPGDLPDLGLADELVALRWEMDRQDAVFARLARAAHARGVGATDGVASTAAFLRHRAGMREGDARAAIESGAVCDLLDEMGAAWRAGEISSGAARTIVAARVDGHDDTLAACEPELLDLARRGDLRALRRATAHFRNLARADGSAPGDHDGLHVSKLYDGRTVITGELSNLTAETVTTALHAYTDPPDPDDPRTTAQRSAAALVRIAEVALAHLHDVNRPRTQVSIIVDWATLTEGRLGRCDGELTGPIHPHDIERALCDSSISRIITGPDSQPLDVGRTRRTIPPALHRALVIRDQGCRYPGCDRPPGWCDAHHTTHWKHGGETRLDRLVLFCDHHHDVAHQPGWTTELDGHDLHITKPDGTQVS